MIALAIIVVLTALLLVYAQEMRTEATASANQLAAARADTVETGAEQWVMATVETFTTPLSGNTIQSNVGFGQTDITTIPAAGLAVGDPAKGGGYFWCLSPNPLDDQNYAFGIQDESAKVNLNRITASAISAQGLLYLPGMTQEACDSIVDWIDTDDNATNNDGGETSYYQGLGTDAYDAKNAQIDTVDELLLVKGVTPALLYGQDLNRDGVIDASEATLASGVTTGLGINGSSDRRGFFNYVTTYSTSNPPAGSGGGTGNAVGVGRINVNTASEAVLMTLPGISQSDADAMVSQRTQSAITGASTDTSWVSTALGGGAKYALLTQRANPLITGRSYQYSADIVAVSGDGRSFKRVRIVVDARTQPAKIVYRKDLTDLGWPLPADVRTSLRAGQGIPVDAQGQTDAGTIGTALP